ncbi:hypothetical protein [Paraconexibacter sp.]|uniref:hypothetical protein n=1 Tax=Paraconexibacter sp. TaxID=2949640 RepID=UPI003567AB27
MRSVILTAVLMAVLASASSASAFTVKNVKMRSDGKRLTYSMVICTTSKATLKLSGVFTSKSRGTRTAKPGATQYQDKGCWPATVSVPVTRTVTKNCRSNVCTARKGRTYYGRVTVTDKKTKKSRRTSRLRTRA